MEPLHLVIAHHHIALAGDALLGTLQQLDGFMPFAVSEPETAPLATITSVEADWMPNFTKKLYHTQVDGFSHDFGRYQDGFLYESITPEGEVFRLWMAEGSANIYMAGCLMPRIVRFALWMAFGWATHQKDTIAIHTSCIVWQDRCAIFLGESGTGKSTHTRLWRENILGAHLLNDDSPILRVLDGKVWMYGSPWSGKTPCYRNERFELAGCVRLSQAPHNKIYRLKTLQAYGALHPSCPPDFAYDDAIYDHISHTLGLVLEQTPVYHLECLPDAAAAQLSFSTLFKGED